MDSSDSAGGDRALKRCAYCKKKSTLLCARCGEYYCSKEHQTKDWKSHQKICTKKFYKIFQEASDKAFGLVASNAIPVNTKISESQAIAVGPDGSEPVCLGCLRPLIYDVMSFLCTDCGWPVCGIDCQRAEMHQLECKAFQNVGFRFNADELKAGDWRQIFVVKPGLLILVIRILLSGKAKKFLKYYQNVDSNDSFWYKMGTAGAGVLGVYYIQEELKLKQFKADDIIKVFHLVQNCAVPISHLKDNFHVSETRAASLVLASDLIYLQHSCNPNLEYRNTIENPPKIQAYSRKNIVAGEKLSIFKGMGMLCVNSTFTRQSLRRNMFRGPCDCERCSDPTELGLYMSSLRCKSCKDMMVPMDPSKILETDWTCKSCKLILKSSEYQEKLQNLAKEYRSCLSHKESLIHLVNFIETHSEHGGVLHGNHDLILQAKRVYCELTYKYSDETGAAFKFDSRMLTLFKKYVDDYVTFHLSFNSKLVAITMLLKIVLCKNTIYKFNNREITKDQAKQFLHDHAIDCKMFALQIVTPQDICCFCSADYHTLWIEFISLYDRLRTDLQ